MKKKSESPLLLNKQTSLSRGLVGAWPLVERGYPTFRDYSGYKNNGTSQNSPSLVNLSGGRALDFSVASSYISIPDKPQLRVTNAVTVCGYFHFINSGATGRICGKTTNDFSYEIGVNDSNQTFDFQTQIGGNTTTLADRASVFNGIASYKNTDVLMVAVYDGSIKKIYINGVLSPQSESITGAIHTGSDTFGIGARGGDGSSKCNFPIYQVLVWNRALSQQEITSLNANPWQLYKSSKVIALKLQSGSSDIAGTSSGSATSSAILTGNGTLVGSSSSQASSLATLDLVGSGSGSASSVATLSLIGSSSGQGSQSGSLVGDGALVGSSSGIASGSGTLDLPNGDIVGSSSGVGSSTADLTGIGDLAGALAGAGSSLSWLSLIGSSNGVGATSGTSIGTGALAGTSAGAASATATLSIVGSSSGLGSSTSSLTANGALVGSSSGASSGSGTLDIPSGGMIGSSAGQASSTAVLDASGALSGASSGVGSEVATLGLIGSSSGSGSETGILVGTANASGSSSGSCTASGTLIGSGTLAGNLIGLAELTAILLGDGALNGASSGQTTCAGYATDAADASGAIVNVYSTTHEPINANFTSHESAFIKNSSRSYKFG